MQCFSHQSQIAVTDENPRVHEPREKQGYHETVSFCLAPGGAVIDLPARAAALIERCGDLLALDRRNRIELAGLGQHLCAETCSPTAGRASWLWQGYSNAAGLRVLLHLVPHRGGGATVVMFANLAFPPEGIRDLSARERQVLALGCHRPSAGQNGASAGHFGCDDRSALRQFSPQTGCKNDARGGGKMVNVAVPARYA